MRHRVKTAVALATASAFVLGGVLLTAVPASAAAPGVLPEGDTLYALACLKSELVETLKFTDIATATTTFVGEAPDLDSNCAGPAAWDYSTNTAYFISWGEDGELATLNYSTGAAIAVAPLTLEGENEHPDGLAIGLNGDAYITDNSNLYSVDKATGVMTLVGSTGVSRLYGFAVHPVTGVFYAVSTVGVVYTVNVETGALTEIAQLDLTIEDGPGTSIWALQIDRDGVFWIENNGYTADLWSARLDDLENTETFWGVIHFGEDTDYYTESLLLVPGAAAVVVAAPALADTGLESTTLWIGGAALLLLGLAGIVTARTPKRA